MVHEIKISQLIGTSHALLRQFGISVFETAKQHIEKGETIVLNFDGMDSAATAFFHASVGNLYKLLGSRFEHVVKIENLNQSDWKWKYEDALALARNPRKEAAIKKALAELTD